MLQFNFDKRRRSSEHRHDISGGLTRNLGCVRGTTRSGIVGCWRMTSRNWIDTAQQEDFDLAVGGGCRS